MCKNQFLSKSHSFPVAAARLAKDTTVDSNSAALMNKDGSEMVGTKALVGIQLSLSNGCADVEQLAKAYNTVKSGSTVSMVTTMSTPGRREGANDDEEDEGNDKANNGCVTISERTDAISSVSLDGYDFCLGDTCFSLGTPCGGDANDVDDEGNANDNTNDRRLERAALHRDAFVEIMKGNSLSVGSLRNNKLSRRLKGNGCCRNPNRRCQDGCTHCRRCVSTTDLCATVKCSNGATCTVQDGVAYCAGGTCGTDLVTTCGSNEFCCDSACGTCAPLGGFCTLGCPMIAGF